MPEAKKTEASFSFHFPVEFMLKLCYLKNRKSTCSKADAPEVVFRSLDLASSVLGQERYFYFFLFSLIEKGKKCNDEAAKGIKQSQYTKEYRNYFESCHNNAPPFLIYSGKPGYQASGGRHPVRVLFPHICVRYYYTIFIIIIQ